MITFCSRPALIVKFPVLRRVLVVDSVRRMRLYSPYNQLSMRKIRQDKMNLSLVTALQNNDIYNKF